MPTRDGNVRAGESYVVFMPLPDTAEPNDNQSNATTITEGESNRIAWLLWAILTAFRFPWLNPLR